MKEAGIEEDDEMEDESSVRDAVDKVDVDNSNRKTVKKGLFYCQWQGTSLLSILFAFLRKKSMLNFSRLL